MRDVYAVEQGRVRSRAAVFLAEKYSGDIWVLASDIAETQDLPKKFLEAILVDLRDHGIVDSRRGRYGGYRLSRPPERIVVGDVIRTIDGPLALTPCSSRTQVRRLFGLRRPCRLRPAPRPAGGARRGRRRAGQLLARAAGDPPLHQAVFYLARASLTRDVFLVDSARTSVRLIPIETVDNKRSAIPWLRWLVTAQTLFSRLKPLNGSL